MDLHMFTRPIIQAFGCNFCLWYSLLYGMGFVPAVLLALWLARERGYPLRTVLLGGVISIVAALAGGPALVLILRPFVSHLPINWALAQIAAVILAMLAYRRLNPRPVDAPALEVMDILFPPVALYIAIARLGCFSAGCCHGIPAWGLPWAVTFTDPASVCIFKGIPVHPTQLYEAAGCLILFGILMTLRNRPAWRGRLVWVFAIGYGLLRFVIEFYRGDVRHMIGPLSLTQFVSLIAVALGVAILILVVSRRFAALQRDHDGEQERKQDQREDC